MVSFLSIPLRSRQITRRTANLSLPLIPDRKGRVQATINKAPNGNRADQGEGQCVTVVQIIERVCASHQQQLGCYSFLAWGDFQKHL